MNMYSPRSHKDSQSHENYQFSNLSKEVVDSAYTVHRKLGPGLLENIYEEALLYELHKRKIHAQSQVLVPVKYDDISLDSNMRLDLIVENEIILELKAVEKIIPLYKAQLLTYLKITNIKLGFLINFNTTLFKDGISRIVL